MAPVAPAAAGTGLTLVKKAPDRSLLGDTVSYTLTAANTSAGGQYNVSFSDILPPELEFDGNVIPTAAGNPKITTSGGQQVLTWLNLADLLAGSDFTLSFDAKYKTPIDPILTPTMTNTANVATSDDPRDIPAFNPNGTVADADNQATDTADTTKIGVRISKGEPSPEGELLRGVHDHRTVYTLTVTNNKVVGTDDVLVSDYIPAGLEFLGCADEDNTLNQTPEYPTPPTGTSPPDAPPLGQPGVNVIPCPTPISVDTVNNPTGIPGIGDLTGVYTVVTWDLGNLQPNETVTIRYAAGIPLQENTTVWPNGTPAPNSGNQGSNLDNNSGPSTRETLTEQAFTNSAVVTGTFKGSTDVPTYDTSTETVTSEDLRLLKSVVPARFTPGDIATFRFKIDTSEYMTGDGINLVDLLPDGYCPLGNANFSNGNPECDPVAGTGPTIAGSPVNYTKVEWKTDKYEVTFPQLPAMSDNDTVLVTMPARMLTEYRVTGDPTVAGDTFENKAELTGNTTPIPAVTVESGQQEVKDNSTATQTTILPTVDKTMKPRYIGVDCRNLVDEPYMDSANMTDAQRTFRKGDTICFKLRVDFPNISTKNAVVGDFVPFGTEYIPGSYWLTPANTASVQNFYDTGTPLLWELGTFVDPNAVFEAVIAVTVLTPPTANEPDITGNLMKMRTENTKGEGESYRDLADYEQAPAPNLAIAKGVRNTTAPAGTWNPPQDNKPVQEGSQARFQVDVTNRPRPDYPGTEFSARGVQVWDVLPGSTTTPQITCASIVPGSYEYIKPGTTTIAALPGDVQVDCTDSQVVVNGSTVNRPTIKWSFPSPDLANDYAIFTGQTLSVLYKVDIPAPVSVSVRWTNTSYVRSMDAFTNLTNTTATYYPEKNVDPTVTQPMWDAVELKDPSDIYMFNATVTKTGTTSVNQTNNNTLTQATIGETITYKYGVKVPAKSTVYNGVLSDTLPAGVELLASPAPSWTFDGQPGTLADFSLDANGTLTFAPTYTNSTDTEQVFEVTVTAQVKKTAIACPGETAVCTTPPAPGSNVAKQNTARFNSKFTLGGTPVPERRRTYTVNIMQPAPRITKAANPETVKSSKEDITYTVTASNATGRSPLNNVIIVDCIPDEVAVKDAGLGTLGTNPNCTTTDKVSITWEFQPKGPSVPTALEDPLEPNTDRTFTYTANIKSGSNVNVKFPNTCDDGRHQHARRGGRRADVYHGRQCRCDHQRRFDRQRRAAGAGHHRADGDLDDRRPSHRRDIHEPRDR